jgi:ATP-binding cassette subfamily B (MDR/TAP) protein 6
LVLKDGQIVEQGSHAELLALDGVFASMWANQITTSGDEPLTGKALAVPEPEVTGYLAEPDFTTEVAEVEAVADEGGLTSVEAILDDVAVEFPQPDVDVTPAEAPQTEGDAAELPPAVPDPENATPIAFPVPEPAAAPVAFPASEPTVAPVAFPASEPTVAPVAFPASESSPSLPTSPLAAQPLVFPVADDASVAEPEATASGAAPGVTFDPALTSPTTSPDPDAEPKRKRISSQNFQRLARKISLTTRRSGSGSGSTSSITNIIPGLKRDRSGDDGSIRGEGSGRDSIDSPTASVSDKKLKKKDKKDKRKSSS